MQSPGQYDLAGGFFDFTNFPSVSSSRFSTGETAAPQCKAVLPPDRRPCSH